jgi:hypothetical protein
MKKKEKIGNLKKKVILEKKRKKKKKGKSWGKMQKKKRGIHCELLL